MKKGFTFIENLITLFFVFFIVLFINFIITSSFKYQRIERNRLLNYIEFGNLFNKIVSLDMNSEELKAGKHVSNEHKVYWEVTDIDDRAKRIRFYSYKLKKYINYYYSKYLRR